MNTHPLSEKQSSLSPKRTITSAYLILSSENTKLADLTPNRRGTVKAMLLAQYKTKDNMVLVGSLLHCFFGIIYILKVVLH